MRKSLVGLILIVTILATVSTSSMAYDTEIKIKNKTIMIDVSHGAYHTEVENFKGNLTEAKNTVVMIEGSDFFANFTTDADALFMSQPDEFYTGNETQAIVDWFKQGGKFLFIGADSDYGGYFSPTALNNLLRNLGAQLRFDSTSISDEVNNDGASYRVAATEFGDGEVAQKVTEGMEAGFILHGPCSILAVNKTATLETYLDLRTTQLDNVEVLVSYSSDAVSDDSDVSGLPTDLYATSTTTGNYPAVVLEVLEGSYLVLAGEAIFTDYKSMYDQFTETGEYNGGLTYGQMFVNNLLNYFLGTAQAPMPFVPVISALALFGAIMVIVRRKK
ncbi:MAG: hypothetical protein ACTSQE_06040 [Candidatus Heimdallarchaeaceae archaeon]